MGSSSIRLAVRVLVVVVVCGILGGCLAGGETPDTVTVSVPLDGTKDAEQRFVLAEGKGLVGVDDLPYHMGQAEGASAVQAAGYSLVSGSFAANETTEISYVDDSNRTSVRYRFQPDGTVRIDMEFPDLGGAVHSHTETAKWRIID